MSWYEALLRKAWPLFVKHVWPEIQEYVIALVRSFVQDVTEQLADRMKARHERERDAGRMEASARQAGAQAEASGDAIEAEVQRRMAEFYRNVAEDYRNENLVLKWQLEDTRRKADEVVVAVEKAVDLEGGPRSPALALGQGSVPLLKASGANDGLEQPKRGSTLD